MDEFTPLARPHVGASRYSERSGPLRAAFA